MKTQKQLQASFFDLGEKPDKVSPEMREITYLSNSGSRLILVLFLGKNFVFYVTLLLKTGNWGQEPEPQNIYHLYFFNTGFTFYFITQEIIFA